MVKSKVYISLTRIKILGPAMDPVYVSHQMRTPCDLVVFNHTQALPEIHVNARKDSRMGRYTIAVCHQTLSIESVLLHRCIEDEGRDDKRSRQRGAHCEGHKSREQHRERPQQVNGSM